MTRLEDIRLERHPAGGYGYLTWHGAYYRIVRRERLHNVSTAYPTGRSIAWEIRDNGNAVEEFATLAEVRRWLQQRT